MQCRSHCGACCIAPSISSAIPQMPEGKPAGVYCIHLNADYACTIFNSAHRPKVCADFKAEQSLCGETRHQALTNLIALENLTLG